MSFEEIKEIEELLRKKLNEKKRGILRERGEPEESEERLEGEEKPIEEDPSKEQEEAEEEETSEEKPKTTYPHIEPRTPRRESPQGGFLFVPSKPRWEERLREIYNYAKERGFKKPSRFSKERRYKYSQYNFNRDTLDFLLKHSIFVPELWRKKVCEMLKFYGLDGKYSGYCWHVWKEETELKEWIKRRRKWEKLRKENRIAL